MHYRSSIVLLALLCSSDVDIRPGTLAVAAEPTALSGASNGLRLLEEMQTVITELAEAAKPSVVSLFPAQMTGKIRELTPERVPNAPGSGAGVIVTPEGHIITN